MKVKLTWLVLFFLSALLGRMYFRDTLTYYVLPWFTHIVLVSSILLFLVSIFLLESKADFHHIKHHTRRVHFVILGLVIICWLFLPARPLSSISIVNRGVHTNLDQIKVSEKQWENNISEDGLTFPEVITMTQSMWLASVDTSPKRVHVRGFAHPSSSGREGEFEIVQFQMSCCIADVRPVGIRVVSEWGNPFEKGTWIEVWGELMFTSMNSEDASSVFINPETMQETEMNGPPFFY